MSLRIELLTEQQETIYEQLLLSIETALLYSSIRYHNFLRRVLVNSEPCYLLAYDGEQLVGALPAFVNFNAAYGNVLNSLPFYGSNGGLVVSPKIRHPSAVRSALLDAYHGLAMQYGVMTSTLIANPLESSELYETALHPTWRDERIGQITPLPRFDGSIEYVADTLMSQFHKKTRNSIRKAAKSGIQVSHSDTLTAVQRLVDLHRQNIEGIGGLFKPPFVFDAIRASFRYDEDYRVYVTEKDGQIIAALLVFFYNRTAEYFTPAVLEAYRSDQPISLLAFEAMQEAARRGCIYWNWGGTWKTQDGVYRFKSRFGAQDMYYHYYICEFKLSLRHLSRAEILAAFPYFYVLPFSVLESV